MEKNSEQAAINGSPHDDDGDHQEMDPVDNMDEEAASKEKLTASDPSKVKFTTVNLDGFGGKNGEAKVDIQVVQTTVGMGKDELMKYANEPYWVRLRMFLFVLFWVGWVAMLAGAIIIILLAPRCPPAPRLEWYQTTVMYQVDVKNFKDADGDGVGDFRGLISKLDYFKQLNVGTLMLSSFYSSSPNSEAILNHTAVDSKFGTLTDFEDLLTEMKERDMQIVIDFNPNHSSDKHPWFQASIKKEEPYTDFYVWAKSPEDGESSSPNNWISVEGDSAWQWNDERQEYYLHTFGRDEPDFNLRNEFLRNELKDILRFWLEKGIDGFKVVAASYLVEDEALRDEPLLTDKTVKNPQYKDVDHRYTVGQAENLGYFAEWRELLNDFTNSSGIYKILMAELSESVNSSMRYYVNGTNPLVDFPINVQLTELNEDSTAMELKHSLELWMDVMPEKTWANWMLGNKRTKRLVDRVGSELIDGLHMVAILAQGTPITYYGDEIGMKGFGPNPMDLSVMQWSNDSFGGFTNGSSFSSNLHPDYLMINVEEELNNKQSHLNIFSRLIDLRNQPALHFGIQEYPLVTESIFSMFRVRKGSPAYLVVLNMGLNSTTVDFTGKSKYLPENARLEVRSHNIIKGPLADGDHPKVKLDNIELDTKQSVVFTFVPRFED